MSIENIEFLLSLGVPFIPPPGNWSVPLWAKCLCCTEKAIYGYVKKYEIPHRAIMKVSHFEQADFLRLVPLANFGENPEGE